MAWAVWMLPLPSVALTFRVREELYLTPAFAGAGGGPPHKPTEHPGVGAESQQRRAYGSRHHSLPPRDPLPRILSVLPYDTECCVAATDYLSVGAGTFVAISVADPLSLVNQTCLPADRCRLFRLAEESSLVEGPSTPLRGPKAKRRVRSYLSGQLRRDCHAPAGRSERRTREIATPPTIPPKRLTASQVWS